MKKLVENTARHRLSFVVFEVKNLVFSPFSFFVSNLVKILLEVASQTVFVNSDHFTFIILQF